MKIRIGTRRSDLALWQAHFVAGRLQSVGAETELVKLVTRGDRIDDVPLSTVEGKAFFTQEIEDALRQNRCDIAVHSHKDLPVEEPPGLSIVAVPERGRIAERLLIAPDFHDPDAAFLPLRGGARVGTSAPRRAEQLHGLRSDLEVLDLRGNVPTRVQRLREGRYDAIVLASAGLERLELDLTGLVSVELPTAHFVPAPAQGALAIQARSADTELIELVRSVLHDELTVRRIRAERALLLELGGGCSLPLGASVEQLGQGWRVRAFLGRDHPRQGLPARWVETTGSDLEQVAEQAAARLRSGEETHQGPLGGLRIALTGSSTSESPTRLGRRLLSLGAQVVHETVIDFEDLSCPELPQRARALEAGDGLAVTSREAARRLAGIQLAEGVLVAAVGGGTARALASIGITAQHVGKAGAREMAAGWDLAPGASVLFPCAQAALHELEESLGARDIQVERLPLYRTVPRADVHLDERVSARIYMSPSAVEATRGQEQACAAGGALRIALGPTTGQALRSAGLAFELAERAEPDALLRLLVRATAARSPQSPLASAAPTAQAAPGRNER